MEILPIGVAFFRNKEINFGIKTEDRRRHVYILGKTGSGKTTLIENMIFYDIQTNKGIGYIDPHGDSVLRVLKFIPKSRLEDVIYFDPGDIEYPLSFNPLENVSYEFRHIVASSILSVLKKIWVDAWSARMEYILMNTLLALLEFPNSTLLDINRMLGDDNFRKEVIKNLKDPVIRAFWENEFARYHSTFRTEAIAPIQNKVGQFITSPLIRNIIGQEKSSFDLRRMMDEGKIFLANLSKGKLGEENSALLGGLLITKFQLAAMSRVDIEEEKRKDFYLYIDEFQNFATDSFVNILSEARKYRLNLILSHQYLDQVPESILKAVFGNVGNFLIFKTGSLDAERLEKEFVTIKAYEFINLPKYHIYAKITIDGTPALPFLARTFPPKQIPEISYVDEIIKLTRIKYTKNRKIVESKIFKKYREAVSEEQEIATCKYCGENFWKDKKSERNVCYECEDKFKSGIKLSELKTKNLIVSFKNPKKEEEVDVLKELLKKLKEE
ncbi:MAG: type IV secretion system DNA-binding domain-containing protein [Candidatus Methanomethyliaceae archaeon]